MRAHLISCLVLAIAVISRTVSATLQTALDVAIRVDTSRPISTTDDVWSCANLDWWSHNKCDYGNCPWGEFSLLNVDLKNTLMRNAMAAFGGKVHLRLGGSLADFVVYNVPGSNSSSGYCKWPDFSLPTNSTRLGYEIMSGCLEMSRWDDLNAFCDKSEANCSILFGINALFGRTPPAPCPEGTNCRDPSTHPTCCTDWSGAWDLSNAEAFLRYTKEKGHPIYAFEFGNELVGSAGIESHISVEDYVADWRNLVQLINRVYGKTNPNKPLTVVPDTSFMSDWYDEFLRRVMETDPSARPDIVTHHLYSLGAGVNVNAWQVALNATVMNNVASLAKQVQKIVKSASPTSKIWVGEAGGCYNSGSNNVTNAFNSGFWYLDQMAVFAQNGHGSYCRQTLAGGYYSLLDANTFEPNPDYYSLLTWSKVMDKNVLQVSRGDSTTSNIVRVYSHCMGKDAPGYQPGGVSLVSVVCTFFFVLDVISVFVLWLRGGGGGGGYDNECF